MATTLNSRLLSVSLVMGLLLALVRHATAADPADPLIPKQVKQWMEQCDKGYDLGQYASALPVCERAVDTLKQLLPEHPIFADALNNLAMLYHAEGKYDRAAPLYLHSVQILEKVQGLEHPHVGEGLGNLALLYVAQDNYARALPLMLRSLRIMERALAPEHPNVGITLNNLAQLYQFQGNYHQAEQLYLRSLRLLEKQLGGEHSKVATSLNNLAELYKDQGNYAQAEALLLRSLKIREKVLPQEHPEIATSRDNLADVFVAQGNYAQAEPLSVHSLRIREKVLGPEHEDVGRSLNNLGAIYTRQGKYTQAEPLLLRGLRIQEKALGPEHSAGASTLHNLGKLYEAQGKYDQAEPVLLRSLNIREKVRGLAHPEVASSLYSLAALRMAQNQFHQALPLLTTALSIRERALRNASTEARMAAQLDSMRDEEDRVYSMLLKDAPPQVPSLALRMSLLRKGRAAESGLVTGWALQSSLTAEDQRTRFNDWQALRRQYERLFLHGPAKPDEASREIHRARLKELKNQIENQEDQLTHDAPQLAQWKLPEPEQIVEQVAARLPKDMALVEFLWVRPYLFGAKGAEEGRHGPLRYIALILFPNQRIESVEIGDAEEIDRSVDELLVAMRNVRREPLQQAQALYRKIMVPLLSRLEGVRRIYLSLDGSLNLIPFAALHDGQQYLIDAPYQIQYLSSGRELLRGSPGQPEQPALVMADPDFRSKPMDMTHAEARTVDIGTRGLYDGLGELPQLQGARAEGTSIAKLLHVSPLLGAEATESRLRKTRSPRLLHIATHGLFLGTGPARSADKPVPMRSALLMATTAASTALPSPLKGGLLYSQTEAQSLYSSALVLAGAAHAAEVSDTSDDGLLTAEEARSLSLFGTQLVVLSACDTGRGTVKAGQGVYGLRRAFFVAGAQTVVMSLWPVSDIGTQGLMQRYYQLLLDKNHPRGRISGLLEAMKAVKAERPHPYFWAPFIANGVDAPLQPSLTSTSPR